MYIPLHNESKKHFYISVRLTKLCFFTVSLPLFAFIGCVLLTMYKDFENANNTHCKVPNVFPSISASIGNYEPQRTIWQIAIYIHVLPRFLIVYLRWKYYSNVILKDYYGIVQFAVLLNILENLSLLGLTFWTSSKHYRKQNLSCIIILNIDDIFYIYWLKLTHDINYHF